MYSFEEIFYESRPYLYSLLGLFAVTQHDNKPALLSGATLLFCGAIVVSMRAFYRKQSRVKINSNNRR